MKTMIAVIMAAALSAPVFGYAACSSQDIRDLKAAMYSMEEIDTICPVCTAQDVIQYSRADKTKEEILALCNRAKPKKEEPMPWYVLLGTKALVAGFDAYHTDKVLKKEKDDGTLTRDNAGSEIFNVYLKYTLPLSSITYALNDNRPDKPHPLLKSFKLYAEGNYGNAINDNDSGAGITIKTQSEKSYKVGVKFETDMETLFSRGKTYKSYANY